MDKKYFKDIIFLIAIIAVCAIGARYLAGGETLDEYAQRNGVSVESESSGNSEEADAGGFKAESKASDIAGAEIGEIDSVNEDDLPVTGTAAAIDIVSPDRITYADGFYYEPISNEVFKRISGISYPVDCTVNLDELRYVVLQYIDFDGKSQSGEMICNKAIAQDVVEIFFELYNSEYQIESIKLIDEFDGDDTASMLANNTSCFNYRVVQGTTRLSNHAKGLAIDLNPFYNPYITYNSDGTASVSPEGSEAYADRSALFPYKIDDSDLAYKLFKAHGFTWGGNWNSVKDYQHFEKAVK